MELGKDLSELNVKDFDVREADLSGIKDFFLNFLIPLVALGIVGGLAALVLYPSFQEAPELESKLAQQQALAARLEDKVATLEVLVDLEYEAEEDFDLINKALVSEPRVPRLLAQIDRMATDSGFEVNDLGYSRGGASMEDAGYESVVVSLGVEGEVENLEEFLLKAEEASRIVLVDDFDFSKRNREGEEGLSIRFKLISPYLDVQSDAVTDESIDLDLSDPDFKALSRELKSLEYYEISPEDYITDIEEEEEADEVEEERGGPFTGGAYSDTDEKSEEGGEAEDEPDLFEPGSGGIFDE